MIWNLVCWALALYFAYSIYQGCKTFYQNAQAVKHIPGFRILIHPHSLAAPFFPSLGKWFNIGKDYTIRYKHRLYSQFGDTDIVSVVSWFPQTKSIIVSDPEAIRFITNERLTFMKPIGMYQALAIFGQNVGVTEMHDWFRHKKIISSSSFTKNMDKSAFQHTCRVMETCLTEWIVKEGEGAEIRIDNLVTLTLKIALFVMLSAGFGQVVPWDDEAKEQLNKPHQIPFRKALHGVLDNVFTKIIAPEFAYKLPFQRHLTHVKQCFDEYTLYLDEMIEERRQQGVDVEESHGKTDLLGALVGASVDAKDEEWQQNNHGARTLSDSEIKGNIYVFLLAGHDTTAHTLAFALGLLAIYKDEQAKLLEHINAILPQGRAPTFDDVERLDYVLGVFLETLRMYPSVVVIPKWSMDPMQVPLRNKDGSSTSVLIPDDADIMLNAPGLHYNPSIWGEDVETFKPSRFIDTDTYKWPRSGFLGFSAGARACLGSKFAKVEAVLVLTLLIRKYEVVLTEDPKPDESLKEFERRMLKCNTNITLTPARLPVVFRPRQ